MSNHKRPSVNLSTLLSKFAFVFSPCTRNHNLSPRDFLV